jgi:hypothetical protein
VSAARSAVGNTGSANSSAYSISGDGSFTTTATAIFAMNNVLETSYSTGVAVSPTSTSQIDDQNPFLNATTQGTAFTAIAGGVQQQGSASSFGAFGPVSGAEFILDLYRVAPYSNIVGQVGYGETQGLGTYEGSFALSGSGDISFVAESAAVPEPSTLLMSGLAAFAVAFKFFRRKKTA